MQYRSWVTLLEAAKIADVCYSSIRSLIKKTGNSRKKSIRTLPFGRRTVLYNRRDVELYGDCSHQRNGWILLSRLNKHIQWKGDISLAIALGQIKCRQRTFGCLTYCHLSSVKTDGSGETRKSSDDTATVSDRTCSRLGTKEKTIEEKRVFLAYRRYQMFVSQRKALKVIDGLIVGKGKGWEKPLDKAKRIAEDMIVFGKKIYVDNKPLDVRGKTLMNMLNQAESSANKMFSFYSQARAMFAEAELFAKITKDLKLEKKKSQKKGKKR